LSIVPEEKEKEKLLKERQKEWDFARGQMI